MKKLAVTTLIVSSIIATPAALADSKTVKKALAVAATAAVVGSIVHANTKKDDPVDPFDTKKLKPLAINNAPAVLCLYDTNTGGCLVRDSDQIIPIAPAEFLGEVVGSASITSMDYYTNPAGQIVLAMKFKPAGEKMGKGNF